MLHGQMSHWQMLHGQMVHGQMLHGEMSLDHLSTFKDGPTKLKWPLRYFPWGDGWGNVEINANSVSCATNPKSFYLYSSEIRSSDEYQY